MCVLAFAWRTEPGRRLVLAANRDELHARPSAPAERWPDAPQVLGGRDLQAGGTWLAVSETGRLAAVTNLRRPGGAQAGKASRGLLTRSFLTGALDLAAVAGLDGAAYNPFNLVVIEGGRALFLSNRTALEARPLAPGIHGVSNGDLDEPWPKTMALKRAVAAFAASHSRDPAPLFAALADDRPAPDEALPDTGIGLERERLLSPVFLRGPLYGTRCSTVILVDGDGRGELIERSFGPDGAPAGDRKLSFRWPAS